MELWRDVVFYEGFYQVSDAGSVRSVRTGKMLHPLPMRDGYRRVDLCMYGFIRHYMVHILVADAFIGPCPPEHEVNHKNGQKADNALNNLEYVTRSENNRHAYRVLGKQSQQGSRHGCAKLTESRVCEMREMRLAGAKLSVIAERFGVSVPTVSEVVNNRIWRHVEYLSSPVPRFRASD